MDPGRFAAIDELFHRALELPLEERRAFLDRACPDSVLRLEVTAMLESHQQAAAWFDQLGGNAVAATEEILSRRTAPDRIGPWRVVREIGRGGMGAVYLAERDDGQFEQRVAIKVIQRGLESPDTIRRFLAERRILSRLSHPGIAQLIDGGLTGDQRPYFVMEYVEGSRITDWCRDRNLGIREKIDLFGAVCEAVEYAHRNLVVHRDLKPANILINASGAAKLLDFGIAKLLDPDVPPGGLETETGARALTPSYAAPEQIRGEPVSTATDVYSLGAILYELLTGARAQPGSGKWEEIERMLREDPVAPSAAVTDPRLSRSLRGDLDTICRKALHREPERRYSSVTSLAADLRRYRNGLPIEARRDAVFYRLGKFLQRHRWASAAAAAVFLLTIAFTAVLAVQSQRLRLERDKARQVADLFVDLFAVVDPSESRGATVTAREILDRGAVRVDQGLEGQPEVRSALLDTLARVYHSLGLYTRAEPLVEKTLDLRRRTLARSHPDVAASLHRQGLLLNDQGRYDQAASSLREALEMRRSLLGEEHRDTAQSMTYLALALFRKGDYAAAEPLFLRATELNRHAAPTSAETGDSLTGLAMVRYAQGKYSEAEPLFREAVQTHRAALGDGHPRVADTLNNLASTLSRLGKQAESEALQHEALNLLRKTLGPAHPKVATTLNNLGLMLMARGDDRAAEPLLRESLEIRRKALPNRHPDLAQSLSNLGLLLQNSGRLEDAGRAYLEALEIRRATLGPRHVNIVQSLNNLGQLLQKRGDLVRAEAMLREALHMNEALVGRAHPSFAISLNNLASVCVERRMPEAEALFREALVIRRKALPAGHLHTAYTLLGLGRYFHERGRTAEAVPMLEEAVAIRRKALPAGHAELAEAERALAAARARADRTGRGPQ